jgi:Arc/MetJ-type ribon-helix-helix transcriptional regulator
MTITLKPELEALIQKRLESGTFQDVEDVLWQALESQDAEEAWLELHNREVGQKLDRAIEEFDRGGGIPGSQVRQRLQEMKASHQAERE